MLFNISCKIKYAYQNMNNFCAQLILRRGLCLKVSPIGEVTPRKETAYRHGQVFLHRLFGYRGMILQPCLCEVRIRPNEKAASGLTVIRADRTLTSKRPEDYAGDYLYYTVAIDERDALRVTRLHNENRLIDYASQEDIIPYQSTEATPVVSRLVKKFFINDDDDEKLKGDVSLFEWRERNPSYYVQDVYKQSTDGITVTAIPFYVPTVQSSNFLKTPSQDETSCYFRYCIRIESARDDEVTLRTRKWHILSHKSGEALPVSGRAVIGLEPTFNRNVRVFQYESHTEVLCDARQIANAESCGAMWGEFMFDSSNGSRICVRIPTFHLIPKVFPKRSKHKIS